MRQYCVYLLTNFTNSVIYTGMTGDLITRVRQHRERWAQGFTKRYAVWKMVYFEQYADPLSAIAREKQMKAGPRRRKVDLIEAENPTWRDLYQDLTDERDEVSRIASSLRSSQ